MRYTLLELTQDVLSSLDSDEINSITDTVESQQVVKILKSVFDDIISRGDLVSNKVLFTLTASGTSTKPVLMTKPTTIDTVEWIKYNCIENGDTDPNWREMNYLKVDDFMNFIHTYNPSDTTVDTFSHTVDGFTFTFHYRKDTAPQYYTSFDDNTLIFDAYDNEVDSTLQSSKTVCYGQKATEWTESDSFTPELQPNQFALLLNEAKALAWAELKQTMHQKAEVSSRRNWRHLQKTRRQTPDGQVGSGRGHSFNRLPDFGRK